VKIIVVRDVEVEILLCYSSQQRTFERGGIWRRRGTFDFEPHANFADDGCEQADN
jgi:hypothetical protein